MQTLMPNADATLSYKQMFAAMTNGPVHASDTVFTTVMSATSGYYNTTVWGHGQGGAGGLVTDAAELAAQNKKTQRLVELGKHLVDALLQLKLQ